MDPSTFHIPSFPQGMQASAHAQTSKVWKRAHARSDGGWSLVLSTTTPYLFIFLTSFFLLLFFFLFFLFLFSFLPSSSSLCFFFFFDLQFMFIFCCCLLPPIVASTTEAKPTMSSSPCLLLFPRCSCNYATKNQIDCGHLPPLCLLADWHQ